MRVLVALPVLVFLISLVFLPGSSSIVTGARGLLYDFHLDSVTGHFLLSAAVTLITFAILALFMPARPALLIAVGCIIAIGIISEFAQLYIPGRGAGLDDLLANVGGALCFAFLAWLRLKR